MVELIRPEVRAAFWRWRDVLLAAALIALGLWWGLRSFGVVQWIGYGLVGLGVIMGVAGFQRVRFRQDGEGPGVVQINERRLAYFGPLSGGAIDVEDMTKLELDPTAHPAPHWVLTGIGGQLISIPVNAAGTDALFDFFASLPGIKTAKMLEVLSRTPDARVVIWARARPLLH